MAQGRKHEIDRFADNLARLLGLHGLPAKEAADMLGMSQSAFSKWASGARRPSFTTALIVGDFFGVAADRLARAEFDDLLANELADRDRFREVEAEIRRRRSKLREVGSGTIFGKPKSVIAMNAANKNVGATRKGRTRRTTEER